MTQFTSSALPAALMTIFAALAGASTAQAADTPDSNDFRLGSYSVFYHTSADNLRGPLIPPGEDLNLKADNLTTLYIGYIRRLSPHFQVELALAIPPVAKTKGVGPASLGSAPYAGQVISTARWIAPTAFIEYNFFDEGTAFRPFIGVGINYTTFYDRDSTAAGNAASGGPTKLSLTASIGPAATAGFTYKIAPHWDATASYSIARVNSNLEADTAGLIRTTSIKFGPQALILSVGYSF